MRARRIRRPHGVHDRQLLRIVNGFEGRERRMQAEETVQVDGRLSSGLRRRYGNAGPQRGVVLLAKWNHYVQSVHCPALEDRYQNFLARVGAVRGAREPQRRGSQAEHSHPGALEEQASRRSEHGHVHLLWKSGEPSSKPATGAFAEPLVCLSMAASVSGFASVNSTWCATSAGSALNLETSTVTPGCLFSASASAKFMRANSAEELTHSAFAFE